MRTEEENGNDLLQQFEAEATMDKKKRRMDKKARDQSSVGTKTGQIVDDKKGGKQKAKTKVKKCDFDAEMDDRKEIGREREKSDGKTLGEVGVISEKTKRKSKKKPKDESQVEDLTSDETLRYEAGDDRDKLDRKPTERVESFLEDEKKKEKKDKKKKKNKVSDDMGAENPTRNLVKSTNEVSNEDEGMVRKHVENSEDSNKNTKKKRKKEKNQNGDLGFEGNNEESHKDTKKKRKRNENEDLGAEENTEEPNKDKKKKRKKNKQSEAMAAENPSPSGSAKKVTFSDRVEVFPLSQNSDAEEKEQDEGDGLVRGKRFSKEEDEIIKKAVLDYIESRDLGEDGVDMIMHVQSHPEVKNCWKEIGVSIPWRPHESVYYRAHILFERDSKRSWTPEELERVKWFAEKHGSDWRVLADEVGKHRLHVKDAWRRIRFPNMKKGKWSLEEYQNLFDCVNTDLRMKAFEEKISKHGMLRDNIPWTAISDKLGTRNHSVCCMKWYHQLTSPMVAEGIWDNADDYRLLDSLLKLDACCIEDVDWDSLLENRSGDVCRKRWNQMVPHIGQPGSKSFSEQVEILAKRYSPDLAEVREEFDNRPFVP